MNTRILLTTLAIFGFMMVIAQAEESTSDVSWKLIQSTNNFERNQAVHFLVQQRQKVITGLIAILGGESSLEAKLDAARVLGKYRAPEAVGVLIKNLDLENQEHQLLSGLLTEEDRLFLVRPISTALEKIGSPAIPALLEYVAIDNNIKTKLASLRILFKIEGDQDIVQLRLQKALAAEKDSQKQARLQSALKMLAETSFAN